MAADVAEVLCLEHGLDYRSAYRVVGRAISENDLTPRGLAGAARDLLNRGLTVSEDELAAALDPARALATRTVTGGAASAPMDAMLEHATAAVRDGNDDVERRRNALATAEAELLQRAEG